MLKDVGGFESTSSLLRHRAWNRHRFAAQIAFYQDAPSFYLIVVTDCSSPPYVTESGYLLLLFAIYHLICRPCGRLRPEGISPPQNFWIPLLFFGYVNFALLSPWILTKLFYFWRQRTWLDGNRTAYLSRIYAVWTFFRIFWMKCKFICVKTYFWVREIVCLRGWFTFSWAADDPVFASR